MALKQHTGAGLLGLALVLGAASDHPAMADPLPLPTVDFALKANVRRAGTLELAHSGGKMRVEINNPSAPGPMIGIIDLKNRKMTMLMASVAKAAVEIEIPQENAFGALQGEGLRVGEGMVAGEPCDLWKVEPLATMNAGPTVACITPDGIALRTEIERKDGRKDLVFEATSLTRGPQDPKLFQLPPDVTVIKAPAGKIGRMLGVPGIGGGPAAPAAPAAPSGN